jgi:hypothetical protein
MVVAFEVQNVSSLAGYGTGASSVELLGAAYLSAVVTGPLSRAVAAALVALGLPGITAANVSVSQVADVSSPLTHAVLFQAVDELASPAPARRRLGGPSGGALNLFVRTFITAGDPFLAQSALLASPDATGSALLLALKALALPGNANGPLSPSQYTFASVELREVSVPPVIPRPSNAARPLAPASEKDPLLGLSVGQWVGVAVAVAVAVVLGSVGGYLVGQRNAPPAPPTKGHRRVRGRGRRVPGANTQGMPGAFLVSGAVARGDYDGYDDDDDEEDDNIAGDGKPGGSGGGGGAEGGADGVVGEMVNPMLRMKLKGKAEKRKAGAFAVSALGEDAAPRVVSVMDAPRPIERVLFDFPITATTNPYHLLYLGEPTFAALIDKEVERANALAGVCRAGIEKLDADMAQRRAALAKGGVAQSTQSSRLLDVVSALAVEAQAAGHAASAEDVAARAAELKAFTVAKQDKALAELRRSKYDELALDLLRLKNTIVRVDEVRMRVRSVAQPKSQFEPSSPLAGNVRARMADKLTRAISLKLAAPPLEAAAEEAEEAAAEEEEEEKEEEEAEKEVAKK